jgi:hypothetical protein
MEWILILSMNITEAGQVSQAPTVVPGFSSETRCKAAGAEIASRLIYQSAMIAKSKGLKADQKTPQVWTDCICLEK